MRARNPDLKGFAERNGVKLFFEVFGEGDITVLLLPTWSIIHSRFWKAQVPYLSRHCRVITFDGRGNGRSDRPVSSQDYSDLEFAADIDAVMDATGTPQAIVVAFSVAANWAVWFAAQHPQKVKGLVFIGPSAAIPINHPERAIIARFKEQLGTDEGWAKYNRHYWLKDYQGFLEFFFSQLFNEPHSTKQIEDCIGWGLETTPETLVATAEAPRFMNEQKLAELAREIKCPVLILHGDKDKLTPLARSEALARMFNTEVVVLEDTGHGPIARKPVKINLLLRDFIFPEHQTARPLKRNRKKRALFISSPIGLGHAQRDLAIARELRYLHPDLEIDWLAQNPVTVVLENNNERIHPASAYLANESAHIESESAEHDLHAFQAIRQMDEIMVATYILDKINLMPI